MCFALRKPLLCRKMGAKTQRGAHAKPPENSEVARAPAAQSEPGPSKQPAQTTQPHTEPPTKPRAQPQQRTQTTKSTQRPIPTQQNRPGRPSRRGSPEPPNSTPDPAPPSPTFPKTARDGEGDITMEDADSDDDSDEIARYKTPTQASKRDRRKPPWIPL
ncbi:hypothetical protein ACRALDRAFT_2023495 [Sodiomyces alcalophilus JCM 7366]|uniref:uncharacterized protein n=1 Tax=Sodiomyces alcalophilus JCM 7366 TaxID=591952 RepID=UPI0039B49065